MPDLGGIASHAADQAMGKKKAITSATVAATSRDRRQGWRCRTSRYQTAHHNTQHVGCTTMRLLP